MNAAPVDSAAPTWPAGPLHDVVAQHANECAALQRVRARLVRAPAVKLHQLRRLDDRIAAQLDGLVVAGEDGSRHAAAALAEPDAAALSTAALCAIVNHDTKALDRLIAVAEADPAALGGLSAAISWASASDLRGIAAPLLAAPSPTRRMVGLVACVEHKVDPGPVLLASMHDADPRLRAYAIASVGQLGRIDQLRECMLALTDPDPACAFQAARSAVLLGDRHAGIAALGSVAGGTGPASDAARELVVKLIASDQAQALLAPLVADPGRLRPLVRAIGASGDSRFVPWLVQHLGRHDVARVAGESLCLITGLDLARDDLERKPPDSAVFGPSDDPERDDVAMDEDDGLPWPDAERIADWWQRHARRFAPGTRCFIGEPPSAAHCVGVLKSGFQRQRIAAAEYLCLLQPGTPLFNIASPAWRQQRLLARMSGS